MPEITVSIRNMDSDLWWKAKTLAASKQLTIKDLIINLLKDAIEKEK